MLEDEEIKAIIKEFEKKSADYLAQKQEEAKQIIMKMREHKTQMEKQREE